MIPERIPLSVPMAILLFFGCLFLLVGVTKGITFQWDIGNFAVGLGTLSLAYATIVAVKAEKESKLKELERVSRVKIAEFRMKWVE
ncbi:hypothetical protein [Rhabdaerophilum sp.]|uniref:hypothetical protein n=1 Tax=Rhabdaerophilum sp. TaxID=2717341 RepID=UPI0038D46EAB